MQNPNYGSFTQPTSQLATDILNSWDDVRGQITDPDSSLVEAFEQRLLSLTSRTVAFAEIGGQQVQTSGKQLAGQRG